MSGGRRSATAFDSVAYRVDAIVEELRYGYPPSPTRAVDMGFQRLLRGDALNSDRRKGHTAPGSRIRDRKGRVYEVQADRSLRRV